MNDSEGDSSARTSKHAITTLSAALRETFREGYTARHFRSDLIAGIVVGIVALPLSMALAIACGVPPQHGLYTAIVAGGLTALLGGARFNMTGPTAAFVVILAPITAKYGLGGLLMATMLAGVMLMGLGLGRMGRLIQFIPHPVTTGFTAGIAVVIATIQIKDFAGLTFDTTPETYLQRLEAIGQALPTINPPDLLFGIATLAVLLLWPRINRRVPAPLVALALAGVAAWLLSRFAAGIHFATIGSRFSYAVNGATRSGIPQMLPMPVLPWRMAGPDGQPLGISFRMIESLLAPATAIALLGAIETLLCAVVADGMTGRKHKPDAELIALGAGNFVAPFFGGFAATGAIARTATGIRSGAVSPVAGIVHALFVLVAVLALAPLLGWLPMASLAALLLIVAWNMSDARHFTRILRIAPRSDIAVLLICFGLTVWFDMVIAVSTGIVLASLLFMRRMAELTHVRLTTHHQAHPSLTLPEGVIHYEIAGPLFFGAAERSIEALLTVEGRTRAVILDMGAVPAMDVTGLVALQSAIERLRRAGVRIWLTGVQPQPMRVLQRGGLAPVSGQLEFCADIQQAARQAAASGSRSSILAAPPGDG